MNIKLLFCMLALSCPVQGYMTKALWQTTLDSSKNSADAQKIKKALDGLFEEHPQIKNIFTSPQKHVILKKPVVANTHFPDTFDPVVHVGKIPAVSTSVVGNLEAVSTDRREAKKKNAVTIVHALAAARLKNLSHNNVVFLFEHEGSSYIVTGNDKEYGVYPVVVSRYFNNLALERFVGEHKLDRIKFPKTFLYHIPGQPLEPSDENYLVVQEHIQGLAPQEFRKRCLWMQGLCDAVAGNVSQEEKEKALEDGKKNEAILFENLSPLQARQRAVYEWISQKISRPQADDILESLRQLKEYVRIALPKLPDKLIHTVNGTVVGSNILCTVENGHYVFYCIDLSLPQCSDPRVNEKMNAEFTGEIDSFVSYADAHAINKVYPDKDLEYLLYVTNNEK